MIIDVGGIPIRIRDLMPGDRNYIKSSWIKSTALDRAWLAWAKPMIDQALTLDRVRVACYEDDENVIAGYAVGRKGLPLFSYVQGNNALNLRGQGLEEILQKEVSRETKAG